MSLPTEVDFVLVKMGDGAESEVFTQICGITDVTINKGVNTSDRFVRDCTAPGAVPFRMVKVNGRQMDISGSGLSNAANIASFEAALGKKKNYKIELYADDETNAGELIGTYSGVYVLTSSNMNGPRDADASEDMALASHGAWTYTAA